MTSSRNSLHNSITSLQRNSSAKSSFEATGSPEINLISLTHSNQCNQIASYLKKKHNLPLMSFNDLRCYSLLHIACLNNRSDIVKLFFDYLKKQGVSDEEIKEWVNGTTDEGFAAIHFASFKGSIILVKLLEEYGADIHIKNHQGLNVLHIAAQGDQPVSLAYFMKKGMSLYELDQKGSTPLHWAAFMGMENAAAYLISWGCELNLQDIESGHTPLHLAVLARSRKVVRLLLLKGADRHIKDNEGKTARDLALDNEYPHIAKLLGGRSWIVECLNIKPGLSRKRTRYSLGFFIGLFLLSLAGNILVVLPYVESVIWVVLLGVFGGFSMIFFLFAWLVNPGHMKNKKKADILNLLLKYEPERVCPECMILRPERSKHCEYCGVCVAVFDHHCPWINNCVGARNHKYFLLFIFSTMVAVFYLGVLAFTNIGEIDVVDKYSLIKWKNTDLLFGIKEGVCGVNILLMLIFGVPLIMLNAIQMMNFIKGQTTNERFGYQGGKQEGQEKDNERLRGRSDELTMSAEDDLRINDNGKGKKKKKSSFVTNCQAMCCENAEDPNYYYQKI